jgi:ribosomal protein L19
LVREALNLKPKADVNGIHSLTYDLMMDYKKKYYERKVDEFLSRMNLIDIPVEQKRKLRKEMLKPLTADEVEYANFMEEASRRVSQTFQVISGNIAELCVERELTEVGLRESIHYKKKIERTDFVIYSPNIANVKAKHRIEVKNVKLRERGTRGLAFDGDTMFGFFDSPSEFTESNVDVIDKQCTSTKGYCYLPPITLANMVYKGKRFKANTQFARDILYFVQNGKMP